MIFVTPYNTTYLQTIDISKAFATISEYGVIDYPYITTKSSVKIKDFSNNDIYIKPIILYGLTTTESELPNFSQTIFNQKEKWSALDIRQFIKIDKNNYTIEDVTSYQLQLQIDKFILSNVWYVEKYKEIKDLKFAHLAFSTWLSDNLSKRFGLDLNSSYMIKILSLMYYNSLFVNKLEKDDIDKLIIKFKAEFILDEKVVYEIYEKVGNKLSDINSFCTSCYEVTNNVRLKGFSAPVLSSILGNNWYGLNSKENILASLEYPPIWISLVYNSLVNKSFNKSFLAQIINKISKRGKGDEFVIQYDTIIDSYMDK